MNIWRLYHYKNRVGSFIAALFGLKTYYVCTVKKASGQFCDYCTCEDCKTGESSIGLTQYACKDGSHICNVCRNIEPCATNADWRRKVGGSWFCQNHPNCSHKPEVLDADAEG